jgi:N-acetyl-gamma-glutamyl-phosphate reductase
MAKLRVGIIGASGYTGSELVRLLSDHPRVEIKAITSESNTGRHITDVFPHLQGVADMTFGSSLDLDLKDLDMIFLALPHTVSMKFVKQVWGEDVRIIDLSGDFRLSSLEEYEKWYDTKHICPELSGEAVYGLPELYREGIKNSRFVSNPGCYPTSAILGLFPLVNSGMIDTSNIVVDSKSGVTGAGIKPKSPTHFPSVNDNFRAYKIAAHRHTPEMEEHLSRFSRDELRVQFTPHLLPINRGILTTSYTRSKGDPGKEAILELFRFQYGEEHFVRLRDIPPSVQDVRGSNFCDVHVHCDERTGNVVIVTAIDNLVKGASGQAVQNMNLMMGFFEMDGLMAPPLVP